MSILHIILSFLLPLLWTIGLTSTFVYVFKKRFNFQQLLPIALMSAVLLVYFITMLFHHITAGIWLVVIIAMSSVPLFILDKQRTTTLFHNILTPGLVAFILLYIFLYIINFNKVIPLLSDSSMHWAPHVWTMWLRDDFYTSPGLSIVNHGDYPPALQLFELIWMKLSGVWREGFLYLALQIISFSLLFPTIGKLTWKNKRSHVWTVIFLFAATSLALPLLLPLVLPISYFYNSIDIDTTLALLFAYGVYLAVYESQNFTKYSLVKLGTIVTFLSLTKQIALIFVGIVVLIFAGNVWLNAKPRVSSIVRHLTRYTKNYQQNWRSMTLVLILLILTLASLKLWSVQTAGYESPDKGIAIFHLGINEIKQIPDILLGQAGNESQQAYPKNLAKHLIQDPAGFALNFFDSVSYLQFFLLIVAVLVFAGFKFKDKISKQRLLLTSSILFVGWGVYVLAIASTFLVGGMKDIERNTIAYNDRYLRTYIYAILVMLVIWSITVALSKLNSKHVVIWILAVLLLGGLFMNINRAGAYNILSPTIHSFNSELLSYSAPEDLKDLADKSGVTFTSNMKILVTEKTRDPSFHYLQYSALPNRVSILTKATLSDNDACNLLKESDYLIVDYVTKETGDITKCLTSPVDLIKDTIYKITLSGDKISLSKASSEHGF